MNAFYISNWQDKCAKPIEEKCAKKRLDVSAFGHSQLTENNLTVTPATSFFIDDRGQYFWVRGLVSLIRFLRNIIVVGTPKLESDPLLYGWLPLAALQKFVVRSK